MLRNYGIICLYFKFQVFSINRKKDGMLAIKLIFKSRSLRPVLSEVYSMSRHLSCCAHTGCSWPGHSYISHLLFSGFTRMVLNNQTRGFIQLLFTDLTIGFSPTITSASRIFLFSWSLRLDFQLLLEMSSCWRCGNCNHIQGSSEPRAL